MPQTIRSKSVEATEFSSDALFENFEKKITKLKKIFWNYFHMMNVTLAQEISHTKNMIERKIVTTKLERKKRYNLHDITGRTS